MARCYDCIHEEICDMPIITDGRKNASNCKKFKNKADFVEVVHGEWFLLDECANEGVYCSQCYKKVYKTEYANQKLKSPYCPNCGSKMDGRSDTQ